MKIAIQGHPTRGKEVIQLLESLGGINKWDQTGRCTSCAYYIDTVDNIYSFGICGYCGDKKIYTLEEFETQFPFKVGDIVLLKGVNKPYEIIALEWYMDKLCYKLDNGLHFNPDTLTTYKKMKEERNITLTLDKAKEWYKKGGELKEVALQAFTEEELINTDKELTKVDLPKTFEEFCNNCPIKIGEYYIDSCSSINKYESNESRNVEIDKNVCPSKQSAEAHLAMIQLEQLRDCYRGLFVTVIGMPIWCIIRHNGRLVISPRTWGMNETFLSFQSKEIAEEYLKNFKPLVEKAGDLI